jgi:hypothetical protein
MRYWDAQTGEHLVVKESAGDVNAIAGSPTSLPLQATVDDYEEETAIKRSEDGVAIAWFPVAFRLIAADPCGRRWAGAVGIHLYAISVEGA